MLRGFKMDGIDFVIPWVDDNDPEWIKAKNFYTKEFSDDEDIKMSSEKAYRDWEILVFWFRAIERYAPWVRKIHFVTWGHIPSWLNIEHEKINIVKHEDYIDKKFLPTFNSRAIEVNFHKIPSLSEKFVYFNDDMFLNDYTKEEDFFIDNLPLDLGVMSPIIPLRYSTSNIQINNMEIINSHFSFQKKRKQNINKYLNLKYGIYNFRTLFMLAGQSFGGYYEPHLPNSFLKSSFKEVWDKESSVLEKTTACRFKNKSNVNQWLFRYWQLSKGNFKCRSVRFGRYYQLNNSDNNSLYFDIKKSKHKLLCINDSYDLTNTDKIKRELINVFSEKFPEKSSFEN